jgi:hypothetical protein
MIEAAASAAHHLHYSFSTVILCVALSLVPALLLRITFHPHHKIKPQSKYNESTIDFESDILAGNFKPLPLFAKF